MAMKKGIFFTIDALLASGIIIIAILLISNFYSVEQQKANVNYASQDLVRVFSTMTVGESDNEYARALIAQGQVTNINNTIFEQVGDFWANNDIVLAKNLITNLSDAIIPGNYGFSVLVNGEEIYSRNIPVKRVLVSSRKIVSGIAKAKPTEGFTARALLSGIKSKKTNAYAYFGGYEGDGNLTKKLTLPNDVISFNSSYLEVDAGGNFNLYINGFFSGSYAKGSGGGGDMRADKWNLSDDYLANFRAGENKININFTSGGSYIAGGFLRVAYITSSLNDTQTPGYEKYMFPGIEGTINLYSSVYVPNSLNDMSVFLNYSSNYTMFLRLGNTTIYENNTNGTKTEITLANSTLRDLIDYSIFNQNTIPLRMGLANATSLSGTADAVLVSDVSGSMEFCSQTSSWSGPFSQGYSPTRGCIYNGMWRGNELWYWVYYNGNPTGYAEANQTNWNNGLNDLCGCRWNTNCGTDVTKLSIYKTAADNFVNISLNITGNKVGLVDFSETNPWPVYINTCSRRSSTTTIFPDSIARTSDLTNSKSQISDMINATESWWGTCTCCGINKAVEMLNSQSGSQREKYIILMSDGEANVQCSQQSNGTAIRDAVQSAWDACNQGISVYSIAFGADADTATMQRMNCSGGRYYNAVDASNLQQAYNEIAGEINKLSYNEQTINTSNLAKSFVHPSSYIEFNYTASDTQFNKLPLSFETDRFENNISTGTLTIYANTSVLDAKVTSYSGSKWTDNLVVNSNTIYRLSDYGDDYQILGDPFAVNIPISSINQGANSITISTGLNSTYTTNGSSDDRVIYTLLLNGFSDYSAVVAKSDGCSWNVAFEDETFSTIKIPAGYAGSDACSYTSATKTYDSNDALDSTVYQLFNNLDLDKDGKLEVKIDENSLDFSTLTISKVPSLWGPAIIEIRVWE
ncbi:VWA domain-containing protein [Candidatus Woesearchaeota archaeon]|nr:VWA domain-containing protein [Candidatus Woesearchaeota archaeon]